MIRSSQHILKYSNSLKINELEKFYKVYKDNLIYYINLILTEQLLLKLNLSSKDLPILNIESSRWRQNIYKQASEIVRSNIKFQLDKRYRRYKKVYSYFKIKGRQINFINKKYKELKLKSILKYVNINIDNISINIDERFLDFHSNNTSEFNEFIGLKIPINNGKQKTKQINLPIKYHKQSLKYKDWNRKSTIQLSKVNNNFYIKFIYEKQNPEKINNNNTIGIDIGYKKLISDSNGKFYGKGLVNIYNSIANKKRKSKNYKQHLIYKENKINEIVNKFIKENINVSTIYIEDLKKVKDNSKLNTKFLNKLQYWSYKQVINKLNNYCEEHGIILEKVSPEYTSQECSKCGIIDKSNRNGEIYQCSCGNLMDADYNASINILHRGIYSSSSIKSNIFL
jgi:putative transposase